MILIGEGNIKKADLLAVITEAEFNRYESKPEELSRLYKYKKVKRNFELYQEVALRRAYDRIPKRVVDKINADDLLELVLVLMR